MAANKYGNPATSIYSGDLLTVWNAEAAVAGDRSQCIAIADDAGGDATPVAMSVEVIFSGDPGVFELDGQDANTDTEGAYLPNGGCVINNVVAGADGKYYGRVEFTASSPLFRLLLKLLTNAVNVTAKVSR